MTNKETQYTLRDAQLLTEGAWRFYGERQWGTYFSLLVTKRMVILAELEAYKTLYNETHNGEKSYWKQKVENTRVAETNVSMLTREANSIESIVMQVRRARQEIEGTARVMEALRMATAHAVRRLIQTQNSAKEDTSPESADYWKDKLEEEMVNVRCHSFRLLVAENVRQ
jgi:hypothetical protein